MREHQLAKAIDTNLWTRGRLHVACWPDRSAVAIERPGVLLTSLGVPNPHLNGAFVARHPVEASNVMESASSFYRDRGLGFLLWVPEENPSAAAVLRAAVEAELTPMEVEIGMAHLITCRDNHADGPPTAGLRFRMVDDAATHADYLDVAGGLGLDSGVLGGLFPSMLFRASGVTGLLAYRDRSPVAACWLLRTGAVAGAYGVVTATEHRGRGYARKLLAHAVDLVRTWGCAAVVLQTAGAAAVFERIGFRRVCRYTVLTSEGVGRVL